jgi:bacteriorhodopsin
MTTSLTENVQRSEGRTELGLTAASGPRLTPAEWLWTVFGIALLIVFVVLVVEDYALPTIIAGR